MNCKKCKNQILDSYYFCPNCGKKIKEPPFKFSLSQTILILLLSIFLPPFGLIPSIKYFIAPDIKAKLIGLIGIVLNIVILSLATFYLISAMNQAMEIVNQINSPQGSVQNQIETLQNPQSN